MNVIAFGTKRAFHGFLHVTRKALASCGLTAARFDMMYAIDDPPHCDGGAGIRQRYLVDALGVTAGVVSRMVRALEALGLVRRERLYHDRRQLRVVLTDAGRACIRAAKRLMLRRVQWMVDHAFFMRRARNLNERFEHMLRLEGYLGALRRCFGDRSTLYFPWGHPDE